MKDKHNRSITFLLCVHLSLSVWVYLYGYSINKGYDDRYHSLQEQSSSVFPSYPQD